MVRLLFVTIFWLRIIMSPAVGQNNGKLIFAQVLYRHGDRTPVEPYPKDPWRNMSDWPTGWGQLTTTGMQQHYKLGKWLRNRYDELINGTYSKDKIYIRSTDVDRTLMSAQSNLAGMFPPTGNAIWNEKLLWQPIPIHTIPEKLDFVLSAQKPCPAYEYALKKLKQSDEFRLLNKRFKSLYKYLTEHTGYSVESLEGAQRIYNILFIENLYNKTLPEWTKKVFPGGDLEWIASRSFATNTYTPELARLKVGPLLKEMLQHFQDKSNSKLKPDRSLWIYSAHDTTIANLLNALKLFEYHSPPYTACILMELRILNDTRYISVFYKNTTAEPNALFIPDCGTLCPLDKMYNLYKDAIPVNWEAECEMSILEMTYEEAEVTSAMAMIAGGAAVLFGFILLFAGLTYYRRRSYFDYRWYHELET